MTLEPTLRQFSLALAEPLTTGAGEIASRKGFLVGVNDPESAARGVGEATPLPGWTESLEECRAALENPPDSWQRSGVEIDSVKTPAARHGYRLAQFDAEARDADRPLAALLAEQADFPDPASSVPVNATVGDGSVDDTVAAAREAVAKGFDCLKLKVGARSLAKDVERVKAVRETVDATIRVDANGAWAPETTREAVEAFAALGVEYVEQPIAGEALSEMGALRGHGIDIATDESIGVHGVDAVIAAEAADVAVLKPMILGGPDATVAAARRLLDHGVEPVVTTTIDGTIARAAAVHVAAAVPEVRACGLATGELLAEDFGPDPMPVEDGRITVFDGPGNVEDEFDGLL